MLVQAHPLPREPLSSGTANIHPHTHRELEPSNPKVSALGARTCYWEVVWANICSATGMGHYRGLAQTQTQTSLSLSAAHSLVTEPLEITLGKTKL